MTEQQVSDIIGYYKIWRVAEYLAANCQYSGENAYLLEKVRTKFSLKGISVEPIYAVLE